MVKYLSPTKLFPKNKNWRFSPKNGYLGNASVNGEWIKIFSVCLKICENNYECIFCLILF